MIKEISIEKFTRVYFFMVFLFIIKQGFDSLLLHQFALPKLIYPSIDNTYWIFHLMNIPKLIASNEVTLYLFDILLISCSFILLFKKNILISRIFFIIFFIYFICVNTFSGHHSHMLVGILLCNSIFCFRSINVQIRHINFLRYYLMFLMTSAALWKIGRGSIFDATHFSNILFNQNLYYNPENLSSLLQFLIAHKWVSQLIYIVATILELIFIVGFFTRKLDSLLLILFFVFFVSDYFIMGLNFSELSIIVLTLLPIKRN